MSAPNVAVSYRGENATYRVPVVECPQGGDCEVVAAVAPYLDTDGDALEVWTTAARSAVSSACILCRQGVSQARALRGLRLGRRERHLLLSASPPEEKPHRAALVMEAAGDGIARRGWRDGIRLSYTVGTHSERSAARRAAHKLKAAGLVVLSYRHGLRLQLTILGAVLVEVAGDLMASGRRVRWVPLTERLADELRTPLPERIGIFRLRCEKGAAGAQSSADWGEKVGVPPIPIFQQMQREYVVRARVLTAWAAAAQARIAAAGEGAPQ
jgi:hypothetical protein